MTISTEVRKAGPFIGNGSASVFPFAFKVFKAADLIVVRRQDNIGTETTLVLDSDYHVTLNGNQDTTPGGVVTLVAGALASGFTLVVSSELPYLQTTDLTNQGGFYPKVITNALDRLTIFCQQLLEITGRTLRLPITAPTSISAEIPLPNPSELIAWNEAGTGLTTVSPQSLVTSIAYGSATADLFAGDGVTTTFPLSTNPASVNNLDVSVGGFSKRPVQGGIGDYSWNGGASITFAVPPPAPTVPGDKNVLVRYMQAVPVSDSDALHAQTREALRRSYAEAGYNLVDGSFETGGVFNAVTDVLLREVDGLAYSWAGVLPKVVAPGTDPTISASYVDASAHIAAFVTPEAFGAKHTIGVDDSAAFHAALATGKRLQLGPHTYYVNLVLTQHFDIEGQGMDRTKLVAFDKTKPVVKNMFREPLWKYPSISKMTLEGAGTLEGVGFAFGDINSYAPGDELIGRVRMTDVFFTNFDKAIQKTSGNIGNVFTNVSTRTNNYAYWARGAYQAGADSSHLMHAGADIFYGGQVSDTKKMCFLVMDTAPGGGLWTFINTVLQFNPGGTFMWDMSGTSLTAFESTSFINIWNEGNATAESVTIDGLSGPRTITPSSKFEQTAYGPDYCAWGKTVQHGTTSTLGRVNIWGNERIALNLEGGGIGTGDYVDLAFSSAAFPNVAGAWLRSTRGASTGRSLSLHTGAGLSADFNVDGGSTIGVAASTPAVATTANKLRANVATGGIVAAFVGPFSSITKINLVDNQNYSATLAGMHLGSVASSGRSLNAAGTLNASGADYAEYMHKDADCGTISKGAICGVTSDGLLTDRFDKAISFVVKSTDPAYVGGDSWGHSPEPERFTPEYAAWLSAKNALANAKACKPVRSDDESDAAFAERVTASETEVARLSSCVAQEPSKRDSDEWLFWEADMEAKRQRVDRVAFSGQVPCNVYGAVPGDYIVPVRNGDGSILGQSIKDPSFEQYRKAVGQVWKVLEDGRAWIAVRVA